jgi:hypothetical protein
MGWQRTDDLDGSVPAEQVTFGLDGKAYVVDLGESEHGKLRKVLQRFLTVAVVYAELPPVPENLPAVHVPASSPEAPPAGGGTAVLEKVPQRLIRVWANANGYTVGPRGRIPEAIIEHYHREH